MVIDTDLCPINVMNFENVMTAIVHNEYCFAIKCNSGMYPSQHPDQSSMQLHTHFCAVVTRLTHCLLFIDCIVLGCSGIKQYIDLTGD